MRRRVNRFVRFNRLVRVVQTDGGSEFEADSARQAWNYCRYGTTADIIASLVLTRKTSKPIRPKGTRKL